MEVWGADIGNAYLEATTKEKLYIVAGPEFEELQGHILVIHKALDGLKTQVCDGHRESMTSCYNSVLDPAKLLHVYG